MKANPSYHFCPSNRASSEDQFKVDWTRSRFWWLITTPLGFHFMIPLQPFNESCADPENGHTRDCCCCVSDQEGHLLDHLLGFNCPSRELFRGFFGNQQSGMQQPDHRCPTDIQQRMEGVCFWSCCKNQSTCLLSCHRRRDSGNFNMFEFCCLNANQRQPTSHAYAMACMLEWDWGSREGLSLNWNPENKTTPHLPRLRPTYDFAAYRCQFHSWLCRLRPQSIVSALSWSCPASRPSMSLLSLSCPHR